MDKDIIRKAVEAATYEFLTLIPRLAPAYRKNAQACVELLKQAQKELDKP